MKLRILTICMVFMSAAAFSQQIKDEVYQINKAYKNMPVYSVNSVYELFADQDPQPVKVESGVLARNQKNKYFKIGDLESVQTEEYAVVVHHPSKLISLNGISLSDETKAQLDEYNPENVEQLLKMADKSALKTTGKQSCISFYFKEGKYSEMHLYYHKKTYHISKVVMKFTDKMEYMGKHFQPTLVITYKDFNTKPVFGADDFTYFRYVNKSGKKLVPKPAYKLYKVNDLLINKEK